MKTFSEQEATELDDAIQIERFRCPAAVAVDGDDGLAAVAVYGDDGPPADEVDSDDGLAAVTSGGQSGRQIGPAGVRAGGIYSPAAEDDAARSPSICSSERPFVSGRMKYSSANPRAAKSPYVRYVPALPIVDSSHGKMN